MSWTPLFQLSLNPPPQFESTFTCVFCICVSGEGPFPAVLDLPSSEDEKRPSLLANKGFIVLTLPVFREKIDNDFVIHLDHFAEAVHFLHRLPQVISCVHLVKAS